MSAVVGRALAVADGPHDRLANVEAEGALIGALLCDNGLIERIADRLAADDFSEPLYSRIYTAIVTQSAMGGQPNVITLKPIFEHDPTLAQIGGMGHLIDLSSRTEHIIGARDFARMIADLARRRRIRDGLQDALAALDPSAGATLDETVSLADAALSAGIIGSETDAHRVTLGQAMAEALDEIGKPRSGVRSGLVGTIDDIVGPLRPGDLDVFAGRPGMAKTNTAMSYSIGAAMRGHGVLFISLEMQAAELGLRALADMSCEPTRHIPIKRIQEGPLSQGEVRYLNDLRRKADALPLYIIDAAGWQVGRVALEVRRYRRQLAARGQKLELVVVDYLQLVRPDKRMENETENIAEVSRRLKVIAKQNGVAVLALSQMNRGFEGRDGAKEPPRPKLSDLRSSGQIEQDADVVMFLNRPEWYLEQKEPPANTAEHAKWRDDLQAVAGKIEFILLKRRGGQAPITRTGYFIKEASAVRGHDFYSNGDGR